MEEPESQDQAGDRRRPRPRPCRLAELENYVGELEAEIARVRAEIARRRDVRGAAEALFRRPRGRAEPD